MIQLSQPRMKRMTAIHGWSGVVLGLLLYAVVATGAVAVFAPEIGRWSVGGARQSDPLQGQVDAEINRLAKIVDPAFLDDIGIWSGEGNDLFAFFHTTRLNPKEGHDDDFGTMFRLDPTTGAQLDRHDGFIWDQPSAYETSALRRFFIDLHVQLYLPNPWGLILTGILGLMMMVAVISGVLIHRHLIRDLFVAERPGGRLVSVRDRHVLSGAWSLPFAFLLAFTGSFFSFAGTIGFPLVALVAFGGDEKAMIETLYEPPVPVNTTPAALASLDYIIADSTARAQNAPPTYIGIQRFGRADARVQVWHEASGGGMSPVRNDFDGPTRAFLGRGTTLGTHPSAGSTVYGLMGPLHFGNFAGLASQAVWGALGVAMCFVILSGFRLWVRKREDQALWRGFGRAVVITGYGLPLGMVTAAYGFFITRPAGDPFFWTPWSFVLGAALAILLGLRIPDTTRLGIVFQRLLGTACVSLPMLRLATGGMTWADALLLRQLDVLTVDLLLLIAGASLWVFARPGSRRPDPTRARLEPAE